MESTTQQLEVRPKQGRSRLGTLIFIGAVLAVFSALNRPAPALEGWGTDFDAAVAESAATDRPVLVAFSMERCGPCAAMATSVLPSEEVRATLGSFVPVYIDVDVQREVANRYSVRATPSFAVMDKEGRVLAQCSGYQPVEEFVAFLDRAASQAEGAIAGSARSSPIAP